MIRRPALLGLIAGVVGILIAGIAVGTVLAARQKVATTLRELPGPVEYEKLRLRLFPLGVTLKEVSTGALPGIPGSEAGEIRLSVGVAGALGLLNGERSLPEILSAIKLFEAKDLRLELRREGFRLSTPTLTLRGATASSPILVETPGIQVSLARGGAREATYTEGVENGASLVGGDAQGNGVTPLDRIETLLRRSVSVVEKLPPLMVSVGNSSVRLGAEEVMLSGELESGGAVPGRARVQIDQLPLAWEGARSVSEGTLSGEALLQVQSEEKASIAGTFEAKELTIRNRRIAEDPIGPVEISYDFSAEIDTAAPVPPPRLARRVPGTTDPPPIGGGAPEDRELRGAITVTEGSLRVGAVELDFRPVLRGLNVREGEISFSAPGRVDLELELPPTPVDDVVESVPTALLGPLQGVDIEGSLSWEISLEAPLHRLSWTGWEEQSRVEGFAITQIDPAYDVRALSGPFWFGLRDEESGFTRLITVPGGPLRANPAVLPRIGPLASGGIPDRSYRFVPYEKIAPALIGAVVTAEDGEFFRHNGVNWRAITYAAERNLEEGQIVVGGSTIPMQLAKNLFLDGDRVLARKIQELGLLALANLSEAAGKERLLEIYLNIIEFGPGIRGIAEAAERYFGTTPSELSVPQAVWLASIIRSPHVLSKHAETGQVPPYWLDRMGGIMEIMVERGRLTEEQLHEFRGVQPTFLLEHPLGALN